MNPHEGKKRKHPNQKKRRTMRVTTIQEKKKSEQKNGQKTQKYQLYEDNQHIESQTRVQK